MGRWKGERCRNSFLKIKDEDLRNGVYQAINQKKIDSSNFDKCKEQCNKIIEEEKENG